jgi:hypothetical protein
MQTQRQYLTNSKYSKQLHTFRRIHRRAKTLELWISLNAQLYTTVGTLNHVSGAGKVGKICSARGHQIQYTEWRTNKQTYNFYFCTFLCISAIKHIDNWEEIYKNAIQT